MYMVFNPGKNLSHRFILFLCITGIALLCSAGQSYAALEPINDEALSKIAGQSGSLFLSDHIAPNELTGAPADGTANFDFYRMGLDMKMNFNLNISKLQLGCGGVNDLLTTTPACDIDLDYVGFMGINTAGDRPAYNAANADANGNFGPDSNFELVRPYIELAIRNDDNPTLREVVGFKIGAETINGALRIGRDYLGLGGYGQESNLTNQENGGTCNPSATTGAGVVNCHSGVNSLSGYLAGVELSAGFYARARVCLDLSTICPFGIGEVDLNIDGCIGRINFNPCTTSDTPFFIDAGGTRLSLLDVAAAKLKMATNFVFPIELEGYGELQLDTRQIHYLLTPNSNGFFLSLQREPVSWPHYDKKPPPNNLPYDACNPTYGQATARCNSAYASRANTGWWLSVANAKMLNLLPGNRIIIPGTFNVYELLGALGPNTSPIVINNPRLDFVAAKNCYGTAIFC